MGPALQRLLSRPSSLELLRTLVGTSAAAAPKRTRNGGYDRRGSGRRYGTSAAAAVKEVNHRDDYAEHESNAGNTEGGPHKPGIPLDEGIDAQKALLFEPKQLLKAGDAFVSTEEEADHAEIFFRDIQPRHDLLAEPLKDSTPTLERGLWTGEWLTGKENIKLVLGDIAFKKLELGDIEDHPLNQEDCAISPTTTLSREISTAWKAALRVENDHSTREETSRRSVEANGNSFPAQFPESVKKSPVKVTPSPTAKTLLSSEAIDIKNCEVMPRSHNPTFGPWEKRLSAPERLEFESALDSDTTGPANTRLVDMEAHKNDVRLWAYLLTYRKRVHGTTGVLLFWNAIQRRKLHLGSTTAMKEIFWPTFLTLGFTNPRILKEVWQHADMLLDRTNERWAGLYVYVVEHFLKSGDGIAAIQWHHRLFARHPPGPRRFGEMCHYVTVQQGDIQALKTIYKLTGYKTVYGKVVPRLLDQEKFKTALDWHYTCLAQGDLPSKAGMSEPLVHHLAIYYPALATKLTRSLVEAGASFVSTLPKDLEDNTKISREMMNLIHGSGFNIPPKKYNDNLGARWFATTWVSLDTAINAIHALGVRQIGPLSLQSIALRDPNPASITSRIRQLRGLGISIGTSLYSRAVEHFADPKNRREENLHGLLHSDQFPDELENGELQEALLATYAQSKDWTQYRRIIEIRSLASRSPKLESANIILRSLIISGNRSAILNQLEEMQLQRLPVKAVSIKVLLRHILHPRSPGKRPSIPRGHKNRGTSNDLNIAITVLKKIMETGSYVPVTLWREILRRLGMLGQFQDLERLSLYLARWYGPENRRLWKYRVPVEIPTSHLLHPLSILFSPSLQKAITEWGFIASLKRCPTHSKIYAGHKKILLAESSRMPDVAMGIKLLKRLSTLGIYIRGPQVRKAIFHRLVTYFGPGVSSRRSNRWGQKKLAGRMREVAQEIDAALGGVYFTSPDINLSAMVNDMAVRRMEKMRSKRLRMPREKRPYDLKLFGHNHEKVKGIS